MDEGPIVARRPTAAGVRAAAARIRPHLPATPLLRSEILSRALEADVWLKNETVTAIASFKLRGGLNALLQAHQSGARRAVTSSTGNHGQAVAYAARLVGLGADIFLPDPANPVKAAMIEAFGGAIHVHGADIDEAKDEARRHAERSGAAFIDDGEDLQVMEGAGTAALEIAEALPGIDALIVPLGGGNLAAGSGVALKSVQPAAKLFSVQAKGSPAVTESFHARRAVERPARSLADGLVCRVPARLALSMLWEVLDDAWLATDEQLLAGTHALAACAHVLVEPAGAAAAVGLWAHRQAFRGKRVVLLLSGANVATDQLRRALSTRLPDILAKRI